MTTERPEPQHPDLTAYETLGLDRSACDPIERQVIEFLTTLCPEDRRTVAEYAWKVKTARRIAEKGGHQLRVVDTPEPDERA